MTVIIFGIIMAIGGLVWVICFLTGRCVIVKVKASSM